ncbi:MAG: hypothetical protein DRR19_28360 [Candidatus Parabeggiatoa sp. nov. 1]|nr:MAG: hypothetical protein DRR19_28360 [Gammaproteobacteria bacterium]
MMNKKTVLFLGLAFAMGLLVSSFWAGKVSKNTEVVENLTVLLSESQRNIQHLERELAKKIGIAVSANNRQAPTTDDALVKAEALLKQGDLAKAALYFERSLSQNPGSWEKIHRYQQSFLYYCHQLRDNGHYDTAFNVLAEVETFMLNQTRYLTVPNIEKLDMALSEIAEFRQTITDALTTISASETRQLMNMLLLDELGTPSTREPQQLTQHIDELKVNVSALQSLDTNFLNETDISEIAGKLTQLETRIATFEEQLVAAQSAAMVSTLVQRAEQFIEKAKNEPSQSELIWYYLNAAESVIRQLVLLTPEAETATVQMAKLSQNLEQAKQEIAQHQSQAIFKKIEIVSGEPCAKKRRY